MKQNNQNQIIYFFPYPQIGGVEKNFLIISNYISTLFKKTYLITGNKIDYKVDKKIELITTSNFWSIINRRLFFIICAFN